jgi:thiosulfate reductase cytochrome b subunit
MSDARHPVLVRVTHWLTTGGVIALLVSGVAILLAHPRLYWGETGTLGVPSLIDLPLPMIVTGQTGWGRSLHFFAAWVVVFCAIAYIGTGIRRGHFALSRRRMPHEAGWTAYNPLQRRTYAIVVFVLAPLMLWTGLAMSPAVTSVMPGIVAVLGGHQSARTLHFIAAVLITVFCIVHIVMVAISGFSMRMRAMTTAVFEAAPRKHTA